MTGLLTHILTKQGELSHLTFISIDDKGFGNIRDQLLLRHDISYDAKDLVGMASGILYAEDEGIITEAWATMTDTFQGDSPARNIC